ncbi:MAG: hypothetical protein R3250_03475 [Melioribacteraceae bacterium]|nr:hypothetical protein [Melioribacteraceae bacterium]
MNNEQLAALNPIILPRGIEPHKIVVLTMKKLSVGQYPFDLVYRPDTIELSFSENFAGSMFTKNYRTDHIKMPIMVDNVKVCSIEIVVPDNIFRVIYTKDIYTEPNFDNPFLKHVKTDRVFKLKGSSYLRYKPEEEIADGIATFMFPTGDNFYSFIRFFEENLNKFVRNICMIQDFNNSSDSVSLSIADFAKMCKNSFMLDERLPSIENVHQLIDDLIYMAESKVERIQAGILRIIRTTSRLGTYKINFGGTVVCNEQSVKRFKYMFHPGLQLVAKHLEFYSKGESLRHKIEKEMFKQL